jgi:hypothetical protein
MQAQAPAYLYTTIPDLDRVPDLGHDGLQEHRKEGIVRAREHGAMKG